MKSAICTLFEGHYHFGLAALINSFHKQGYKGSVYAGFRGVLPLWAADATTNLSLNWDGAKTFRVKDEIELHFLPLDTNYHLTNYKPDFMLRLWAGPAQGVGSMFYFDPDIIISQSWSLFEEWTACGVALSEDVNSPLSEGHPRRVAWRRYFNEKGFQLKFKDSIYVNGGFIGVSLANKDFLDLWKKIQEVMASAIGGLNLSIFNSDHLNLLEEAGGPFKPFVKTDQDALNAAIEAGSNPLSLIGKEGMGFSHGFVMMYHALGAPKPWMWKSLSQSFDGRPPRQVDLEYWNVADGPIQTFAKNYIARKKILLRIALAIGRLYKRN